MNHPEPKIRSDRGPLLFASCRSGGALAAKTRQAYHGRLDNCPSSPSLAHLEDIDYTFSDGEICVRLDESVNGRDVFLFQNLQDPTSSRSVNENYLAFLIGIRTLREWGAQRVTGVLPYLAYSRQDKPTDRQREPTTVELMADLSIEAGLDHLITWAPHSRQIRGFYGKTPVTALDPLPLFVDAFLAFEGREDVIGVAPDMGASRLMIGFCRKIGISCAVTSKFRPEPEEAQIAQIMGDFNGKSTAILLDDMINTGGTVEAVIRELHDNKGIDKVHLGVSHYLCSAKARRRLQELHEKADLDRIFLTDSVQPSESMRRLSFVEVRSIAQHLAQAIRKIHENRNISEK